MSLELDPRIDIADAPTIRLAGASYFVPQLVLRQMVKIGPLLPEVIRLTNRRATALSGLPLDDRGNLLLDDEGRLALVEKLTLSEASMDIALRVIVAGLTRAYPAARLDDLYDLPIADSEIVAALTIVVAQTRSVARAGDALSAGGAAATSR